MNNDFHVHNDIQNADEWYDIPSAALNYGRMEVYYILQEDRIVFFGPVIAAEEFMRSNNGIRCEGIYRRR